ncbi:hypothetical protein LSAT2_007539 [Lamellibrachia satsuma]|nr:hypothetical protein LSAT2_007539 [Lamellibrachia satsuma]
MSTKEITRSHVCPFGPPKLVATVVFIALVMPWQSTCTRILPEHEHCIQECWLKHSECLSNVCRRDPLTIEEGTELCQLQRKACLQACIKDILE